MRGEKLKLDADAYITVLYTSIPAHNVRNCIEEKDLEVVEKLGGPCGGRTCGPLIMSETKGIVQVLDDWAILFPYRTLAVLTSQFSSLLVSSFHADLFLFLTP